MRDVPHTKLERCCAKKQEEDDRSAFGSHCSWIIFAALPKFGTTLVRSFNEVWIGECNPGVVGASRFSLTPDCGCSGA